jgi:micrococcal nuclease
VTVVEVVDGDTVEVDIDGRRERVRLVGINAPERDECLAGEATTALADLLARDEIRLERDQSDRDQYGRLLRYVFAGGELVNEVLVAQGLAISRAYPPDTARQDALDRAQTEAREAQRGQWAPDACGRPAEGAAALAIAEIRADPPGDDTVVLNDEFVVIANEGADAVPLAGWGLRDESASHRFTFPAATLDPGEAITVHSGCGTASDTDLYWCVAGSAVWNNDGDTVFLVDPAGNVAVSRSYEGD